MVLTSFAVSGCGKKDNQGPDENQDQQQTEKKEFYKEQAEETPKVPADQVIKLKYANFPPPSTFPCVQMDRWVAEVEKRTNGMLKVDTFPGSTLLNPKNMYEGVVGGIADIGCFAMSYMPGRFPVSEAVDLPIGFTNATTASLTLYDLIEKYDPAEFKDVKIVTMFTCPPASLMTSKPVKSLADLDGMQLRVSGTGVEVIKRLGGSPVGMPMSDTPSAIQKGVVSGIVSSLEVLKDMNFAAYCPYATRTNLHVVTFAVIMNKDKYNSLPAEAKEVIDNLARGHCEWTGRYVDNHVEQALQWAKQKYQHQVFMLPAEETAKIPQYLNPMIKEYIDRVTENGLPGEQIMKDVYSFKAAHEMK